MLDPMTMGAVGGAGLGILKYPMDVSKEHRDRAQAAAMIRWSPWTGLKPNEIHSADLLGNVMQGGSQGAAMGQNVDKYQGDKALQQAQIGSLNAQTKWYGGSQPGDDITANAVAPTYGPAPQPPQDPTQYQSAPKKRGAMNAYAPQSPYDGMQNPYA